MDKLEFTTQCQRLIIDYTALALEALDNKDTQQYMYLMGKVHGVKNVLGYVYSEIGTENILFSCPNCGRDEAQTAVANNTL